MPATKRPIRRIVFPGSARIVQLALFLAMVLDLAPLHAQVAVGRTAAQPLEPALESGCVPSWLPTFGGEPGLNNHVRDLLVHDDGSGSALFVAGGFSTAGGVVTGSIARWDGSTWSPVGTGLNNSVFALTVFDDGAGPKLYAGGSFNSTGDGDVIQRVAVWDGVSWSPVGPEFLIAPGVLCLEVYDDGTGPALYAGGQFTLYDETFTPLGDNIAKWDGRSWSSVAGGLGTGTGNQVQALSVHDDGSGPALYAGGQFSVAGGGAFDRLARWDGSAWSAVGGGLNAHVAALETYDDGSGDALYVGGGFNSAGGSPVTYLARWDGATWTSVGAGLNGTVNELAVLDVGGGAMLHVGGTFASAGGAPADGIAAWDGSAWTAFGGGLDQYVSALAAFDAGGGLQLCAGGSFTAGSDIGGNRIAAWDGSVWTWPGSGLSGGIRRQQVFDDGGGPALYVAGFGEFIVDGVTIPGVGRWDGSSWSALGGAFSFGGGQGVGPLAVHDDGNGSRLYAGGDGIRMWDGSNWVSVGGGPGGSATALLSWDDGGGQALYATGNDFFNFGLSIHVLARWDGSSWSYVSEFNERVNALVVHDDGSGEALYAAGGFSQAGGMNAQRIARWNGSSWSEVGGGFGQTVEVLVIHDDGTGNHLYAGGQYASAGFQLNGVERWDGTSWSALGAGLSPITNTWVSSLASFDDGTGSRLYVGGQFTLASDTSVKDLAQWDGTAWSGLGGGVYSLGASGGSAVRSMTAFDDGSALGPTLMVGGRFSSVPDTGGDSYFARWGGCSAGQDPWTDLGFALAGVAGDPLLEGSGSLLPGSINSLDLSAAAPSALAGLFVALADGAVPFYAGTLVPFPFIGEPFVLVTNGAGTLPLPFAWPTGVPAGTEIWFQYALSDGAAPFGYALSNALKATTP